MRICCHTVTTRSAEKRMTKQERRSIICSMAKKQSAYPKSVLATHYATSIKADTIKDSRANLADDTYMPDVEESVNLLAYAYTCSNPALPLVNQEFQKKGPTKLVRPLF